MANSESDPDVEDDDVEDDNEDKDCSDFDSDSDLEWLENTYRRRSYFHRSKRQTRQAHEGCILRGQVDKKEANVR